MKKEDLDRRRGIATKMANAISYPFKDLQEGRLCGNKSHIRRQVAKKLFELLSPKNWTYEGTDYSVIRVYPKLQSSGSYTLHVEIRDEEGKNKTLLLQHFLEGTT